MAEKKESLSALKMQLGRLQKKEQTPEVMEQVDSLKLRIETLEEEAKKAPKPASKLAPQGNAEPEPAPKGAFKTFEKWSLTPKGEKIRMIKEVRILAEHAATLNDQKQNTLVEYIEKEG